MSSIEDKIRNFLFRNRITVMGMAGPGRLDGPPSLDPTVYHERREINHILRPAHECECHI